MYENEFFLRTSSPSPFLYRVARIVNGILHYQRFHSFLQFPNCHFYCDSNSRGRPMPCCVAVSIFEQSHSMLCFLERGVSTVSLEGQEDWARGACRSCRAHLTASNTPQLTERWRVVAAGLLLFDHEAGRSPKSTFAILFYVTWFSRF